MIYSEFAIMILHGMVCVLCQWQYMYVFWLQYRFNVCECGQNYVFLSCFVLSLMVF